MCVVHTDSAALASFADVTLAEPRGVVLGDGIVVHAPSTQSIPAAKQAAHGSLSAQGFGGETRAVQAIVCGRASLAGSTAPPHARLPQAVAAAICFPRKTAKAQ